MADLTEKYYALEKAKFKKSSGIEAPWWYEPAASAIENIEPQRLKVAMYKDNKLSDQGDSLALFLKAIDNNEAMKLYDLKLEEFKSDSSGFADHALKADVLTTLGNRKRKMYNDFSTSIQETSDFINTDDFLDTADEFVNIQDTIDRKEFDGSVTDFLQSELANANRLHDNMVAGFQIQNGEVVDTNFRYNKAETNDKESFRKLRLYRDRLDLATKSLAGDGKISPEEAQAIIIGDEKHYAAEKVAALSKAENNYKFNNARVVQWSGLETTAVQNKLKAEAGETNFLDVDIDSVAEQTDDATYKELSLLKKSQSWDGLIKALMLEKAEYKRLRNEANENYKNWYGKFYENLEGGMTEEDVNKLNLKLELEEETKKELDKKMLEEAQRKTIEKRVGKDKILDIGKKTDADDLLVNYIEGNISDSVLRNVGGQSLVNRASRIKDAYKGEYAGKKMYKGKPISNIDTLKELKYGSIGDRYSWSDVSSEIYSSGKSKQNINKIELYLNDDYSYFDLRWKVKRDRVQKIKSKFKSSKLSIDDFKNKYPKDYKELTNLLTKAEIR